MAEKLKPASEHNQEMILLRMSLRALRQKLNEAFNEIDQRLESLLPETDISRYQREKNADWKSKVKFW